MVRQQALHGGAIVVELERREQETSDNLPALTSIERLRAARFQGRKGRFHDLLNGQRDGLFEILEVDDDVRTRFLVPVVQTLRFHLHIYTFSSSYS